MEQAFLLLKNQNERWDEIIREYNERKFDELMAGFHQRYSPNRSLRLTSARNTSKYHPSQNMHLARKLMNHENTSFRDHNLQMGRGEELPLETIMTQEPLGGRFVFPAHTMGLTPTEGRQTIDVPESKRSYPVNLFGFEGTPERYGKNQDPEGIIYGNLEEDSVRRLNKNPFMLRDIQRAASMFLPRSKDAPPSRIGLEGAERNRVRELAQMLMDAKIPGALIDPQTARAYGIESFQDIIPTKIGPDGKVISSITESLNDLTGNIGGGMDPLHGTFQQWERNMGPSGRVAELDETHTSPEQMQLLDDQLTAIPGAIMANPTQFYRSEPMDLAMRLLKDAKIDVSGQHATKNDPRFWDVMQHYGKQDEKKVGEPFLPYNRELAEMSPQVNELLAEYGYEPYYFGGQYGNFSNLGKKNYTTGHLAIYDPSVEAASFGDTQFTDNWRKLHELGHAQGLEDLNHKWGEGRRLGRIGVRTPREMLRAVDWETMALMNQRKLMNEIGLPMKPEEYNRDWNTTVGDAGFRAVTGQFTSPTEEGFVPHDERISPSHAMNAVTRRAEELGLDMDETLRDKRGGARKVASEPMEIAMQLLKERVSPEAKRHKLEYDKKYESSPERVKYREELNRERRRRHIMGQGGPDMSHTKDHTIVPEDSHTNRARHFKDKGTLL